MRIAECGSGRHRSRGGLGDGMPLYANCLLDSGHLSCNRARRFGSVADVRARRLRLGDRRARHRRRRLRSQRVAGRRAGEHGPPGNGGWITGAFDPTAAGEMVAYNPNANAPKTTAPLANPPGALVVPFVADPTQTYKLWVRSKP